MKTAIKIALVIVILTALASANPRPEKTIAFINIDPPQIGLTTYFGEDMSGKIITTVGGTATINDGVYVPEYNGEDIFIFDSTNTSGFVINPESDYIYIGEEGECESARYGRYCWYPAPIIGHPLVRYEYIDFDMPLAVMSYIDVPPGYLQMSEVVINEVNCNGDWNNKSNYIELYNSGEQDVDLSRWWIIVDDIYEIPEGTTIAAHGFFILDADVFPPDFGLTPTVDNVYLAKYTAANDRHELIDEVGWSSDHGTNVSFMRYPDGDVHYSPWPYGGYLGHDDQSSVTFENGFPSRGASNRHDCPGFTVIGTRADSLTYESAEITWTDPIWDSRFEYSIVVKSTDSYPATPDDGEIIYQGTDQEYIDLMVAPETITYYTVFAVDVDGQCSTPDNESQSYMLMNAVGIKENNLPKHVDCLASYPNPFNAQTTISFSMAQPGNVELAIYDITGRLVTTLANRYYQAGNHSVLWNAGEYSSGVYFTRLVSDNFNSTDKIILLK